MPDTLAPSPFRHVDCDRRVYGQELRLGLIVPSTNTVAETASARVDLVVYGCTAASVEHGPENIERKIEAHPELPAMPKNEKKQGANTLLLLAEIPNAIGGRACETLFPSASVINSRTSTCGRTAPG